MTGSRETFLKAMRAAEAVTSGTDLLDMPNPQSQHQVELANIARRFHRNGVAVGCFVAFEAFIAGRSAEIADELTAAGLPKSMFPEPLVRDSRSHAPKILADMLSKPHLASQVGDVIDELSNSWSNSSQAWTVPKAVMRWQGSNIGPDTLTRIMTLFGVVRSWDDLTGIVTALGMTQVLPTESLFKSIADARHSSAHDANYSAEIIQLRGVPRELSSLAFAFDAIISVSAACIKKAQPVPSGSGRRAVDLTRIVLRPGAAPGGQDAWAEFRGPAPAKGAQARRATKVWKFDPIASLAATSSSPRSVFVSLREEGPGVVRVVDWRMPS